MYRGIDKIPVLAKAGAIIPMTEQISAAEAAGNPDELTVRVYPGADNGFTLYEDDNVSLEYKENRCVTTEMKLDWSSRKFVIMPSCGELSLIPKERSWEIKLHKITARTAIVLVNGREQKDVCRYEKGTLTVILEHIKPEERVEIILPKETEIAENPVLEMLYDFLNQAEIAFNTKDIVYEAAKRNVGNPAALLGELQALDVDEKLQRAVLEIAGAGK